MNFLPPSLFIHRFISQGKHQWLTCADINNQEMISCGTDQGIIYQTYSLSLDQPSAYKSLIGHTKLITDLCYYDSNDFYLLSCSADNDIRLWHSLNSQSITIYRCHLSPIWCLAAHYQSDRFASGSMDRTVRLWTPERQNILRTLIYPSADINTLAFHPNGKYLAAGSADGWIILWSLEQAQPARILKSNLSVEHITFASDGNQLISINADAQLQTNTITQWDIRSAAEHRLVDEIPHNYPLLKPCQIRDTQQFVTGFHQSLLVFYRHDKQEENKCFRTSFTDQTVKRLIHLSSNQSNKLLVIAE